jgi:uncharacterized repeat protein (TIGR01451 family)
MKSTNSAKSYTNHAPLKLAMLIFATGLLGSMPSVYASDAYSFTVDVDGPDDVPLQEDVTQMGFDTSHLSEVDPYWSVFFAFDDVATTSASQTVDGCAFFDADGDGYADFSVCASLASPVAGDSVRLSSAALYDCKDSENKGDRGARCPFVGGGGDGSNGIIAQDLDGDGIFESDGDGNALSADLASWVAIGPAADPFSGDPLHIAGNCRDDATGSCLQTDSSVTFQLYVDEFSELSGLKPVDPAAMTLTNVCSFTSVDPGSERKDCIVNPGSGFIRIIKNVTDDPDETFEYTLNGQPFKSITTVDNTFTTGNLAVEGDVTHTLLEVLPPDGKWEIVSASCDDGTDLLDADGTQSGLLFVAAGQVVTCTFVNNLKFVPDPAISIVKTAVDYVPGTVFWNETDGDGSPDVGETIDYTFAVKNIGNVDLSSVQVIDALIESQSAPLDNISCPATTLATDPDLEEPFEGELTTCTATYALTQADIDAGKVDNVATAKGMDPDGSVVEDTDPETVLLPQSAALSIVKNGTFNDENGDGNADVGETISYTFTVSNDGNVTLTNVTVSDPKVTVSGGPTTLDVGETDSTTFTGTYTITQADIDAGKVDNTATADSDESAPADGSTSTELPQSAALTITKTVNKENIDAPQTLTYTITVENTGNVSINNVQLTDSLVTVQYAGGDTDNDGILDVDEIWTYTATYGATQTDIDAGNDLVNTASVTSTEVPGPTYASAKTTITQIPSLAIDKTAAPWIYEAVGDVISYSYDVTNDGNVTISGPITVADDKATVTCPAGDVAPGASTKCTASYTISQADMDAGSVTNIAYASGMDPKGGTVDSPTDTATVSTTQNPTLSIVKKALDDLGSDGALGGDDDTWVETTTIMPEDVAAFQITVTNTGNVTIYGAKLEDSLPNPNTDVPDLTWSVASQTGIDDCTITAGTLLCGGESGIALAPDQGFTVVVFTIIPSDYFTSVAPGGNGTIGSNFEIDGNTQLDVLATDLRDWNGADYSAEYDEPSGQTDDSFGKGSKNDHESPIVVDGSIPNNKSDLLTMAAAAEGIGSANFVYLAWLRAETLGTVNIDFELNQSSVLSANGITPQRSLNDVIISFDFAAGENVVQLSLRKWLGTQWSEPEDLSAPGMNLAKGAVNDPVAFPGVEYPSRDLDDSSDIAELTFGEAVINATQAFGSIGCRTFNSVYVKSRSSTSFTAALKDFIAPQQVQIDTCATIKLPNTAKVTSSAPDVEDDAAINVTNDSAVAEARRTAPID